MNFYKHHIGDYAAATAHLSFTEDAAYTRLLRIYYRDERPLPVEIRAVQRLVGARMPEEQEAVETVLREFFRLTDDGWHNKRCDEEIAKAQEQAATNRRIAEEREARRKATKPDVPVHESCNESSASREPSHKPLATSQTPLLNQEQKQKIGTPKAARLPPDWFLPKAWGEWAEAERPDLDIRREADSFRDYWVAKSGRDATKNDWQATWRNWIRKADGMRRRAGQRAEPSARMGKLNKLEDMKNGLGNSGNHHGDATLDLLGPRSGTCLRLGGGNGNGVGGSG